MRSAILRLFLIATPIALPLAGAVQSQKPENATIRVDVAKASGRVSRYLSGACIEDVNHEIYGGLYSQMIFGESFQEPEWSPVKGFHASPGNWRLKGDSVWVEGRDGPTLVSDLPPFVNGEVGVEVFLPDRKPGNAGLIVRVANDGMGANSFDGYEISLDAKANVVRLGRHRQDWNLIKDTPYPVPVDEWIPVVVRLTGTLVEVLVQGKSVVRHDDGGKALPAGTVGVRPWQREARFRSLWIQTGGKKQSLAFQPLADADRSVSGMWRAIKEGTAKGKWTLETAKPFAGEQSQRLAFVGGEGEIGIENRGLNRWGMSFGAGKSYEGYVWVRAEKPADVVVGLESRDSARVYADAKLTVSAGEWQRLDFRLTPRESDKNGRFSLKLNRPGSVLIGHVFLQPGEWGRFKGLPVRRDVAEGMIDLGFTVLRYGGSMVNVNSYRWKNMIGPRDRRPPYPGMWYHYSTNGWGIVDFLNFCEAAGFLAIPAFHTSETPQSMADFVAYVNGSPDSPWGKKRVADGHLAAYRLKHIEFGNEERVDEAYWQRFQAVAKAVWAADPEMILVVGDFAYGRPITDPDKVQGAASGITNLSAHRKILELALQNGREVWFDIHLGTEHPGALGEVAVLPSYVDALGKLAGGANHKVAVFELNAGNHAQKRALANAIALGSLQQLGERIPVVCSANGLQPDKQNDNGWDQGLLFLNPSQVWPQPPGYVNRLVARSYQPVNVPAEVSSDGRSLKVAAALSEDGKTLVVRVVNPGDRPVPTELVLKGFTPTKQSAKVTELAGPMAGVNTAEDSRRIVPRENTWKHGLPVTPRYTFPPTSFTVLTFE
jgi:alpha-L-arabinofuranosidase